MKKFFLYFQESRPIYICEGEETKFKTSYDLEHEKFYKIIFDFGNYANHPSNKYKALRWLGNKKLDSDFLWLEKTDTDYTLEEAYYKNLENLLEELIAQHLDWFI